MQRPNAESFTLNDILITKELSRRVSRAPNLQAENQAMRMLIHQMTQDSETLMQTLVDTALELCEAGTTGLSLLEITPNGEEFFRWNALAGTLAHHVGNSTPRDFSPCGVCLDQGSPVLFSHPERYFTYFQAANTPIVEGLVLPLVADHHIFGTIWIMSHNQERHFDSEDVRIMTSLADFTATALLLQQRQTRELLAANAALEAEIGERKQAEERTRTLIANLPGGAVFVVDRNLRYLLAEGESLAAAGFKSEDFVGRTIFEVLPPELAAGYEPHYRQALAGKPFEQEHNAHHHTYISRGTPLRAENGEIYAVLVISYDITDRKQAEADLRESEERLRLALSAGQMGTWQYRFATDEQILDPTMRQLLGLPTGTDVIPLETFLQIVYAEDRALVRSEIERSLYKGSEIDLEFRVVWQDGSVIWLKDQGKAICGEDDRPLFLTGAAIDITQRKQAEIALRESEEKYRSLFESINDGFALLEVLYDDNGRPIDCRFLEVSPSFEAQTGLPQAQGKTLRELIPSVEPDWFEYYHQALVTNTLVHFEMQQGYLKTWFEVDVFPYGKPQDRRVTIVFRNINERKQAEVNQIQLIREQTAREQERQRAETLAELDRAKTLFFTNISHEFRTPLTLCLAPLQDVLNDRTHPLDLIHRERLELVHRNSLRLLRLVNTLLDFSRIEAGRMEAVYEPTDLALFTTELASVFRSAIDRAGLQLIVDCPPLPEPVYVDREMWEKIVLNLLSNAFKFTFEGEISVRLHPSHDNQAILQIEDTGTGIEPEHLPHLFERFYQVRGTRARTHEGSGIGLALVYELVRLHNSTLEVNSTVGEGTCFTIALPFGAGHLPIDRIASQHPDLVDDRIPTRTLAPTTMRAAAYVEAGKRWLPTGDLGTPILQFELEPPDPVSPDRHLDKPTDSSESKILLVDDNSDMREYLTRILGEYVQVNAVADGVTALAMAQEQVPDLILSDVMMPGLDGFELLQALRADPRTKGIPIILLSARAGEEAIVEGLEAGADDYLIKPFSAQELISRVTAHLQMARLRGEALQEAKNTLRNRDEFISLITHELNTPLVSILGWTRLLRANPPSPTLFTKALDTIERNATLQAKLVQDLLDISRISAGKLHLNLQPIELTPLIETAIATVSQTAANKGIDLIWQENVTEPIVVMGEGDRLCQVLTNLLTNAIKFTPEFGSVTLELSTTGNGHASAPSYTETRVTDTGIGIAADFLPHVFDRFRQAEGTSTEKGLGLGLAIARHIVELHHGTIQVESPGKGQGATFTIRLPTFIDDKQVKELKPKR